MYKLGCENMKFIKKNIGIIILLVVVILIGVGIYYVKKTFFSSETGQDKMLEHGGIMEIELKEETK